MATLLSNETWVFSTRGVDGTLTIGACFVFLAYVLHPAIEMAYRRVRAYRAWRAIEKGRSVDVTNYFMVEEVLGGRGRWDAARIITVLLAVFSLASWGLELSMDLAYYEGDADLLNRPPPVLTRNVSGTKHWQVSPFTCVVANLSVIDIFGATLIVWAHLNVAATKKEAFTVGGPGVKVVSSGRP